MKDLPLIIGSHVSMSGKDMMEGSVREEARILAARPDEKFASVREALSV